MAKFTVTRLLETSRILATDVGQAIPDFFNYMAEFVEQTTRSLRSGLTFADNFACDYKTVSLTSGTAQKVTATKTVIGMLPLRVGSTSCGIDSFGWYYDAQGALTVKATFTGSPTTALDVLLVILFS